jgi:hypothetical protein
VVLSGVVWCCVVCATEGNEKEKEGEEGEDTEYCMANVIRACVVLYGTGGCGM